MRKEGEKTRVLLNLFAILFLLFSFDDVMSSKSYTEQKVKNRQNYW